MIRKQNRLMQGIIHFDLQHQDEFSLIEKLAQLQLTVKPLRNVDPQLFD